jgi:esterase/lipase
VADRLIYLTPVLKYVVRKKAKAGNDDSDLTDPQARLRLWSYEENPAFAAHELLKLLLKVHRLLPQVTCPLLLIHSTGDRSIRPDSARFTYERVGGRCRKDVPVHLK